VVRGLLVTVKVFEVDPVPTVTLAGTVAAAVSELFKATAVPPAGAGLARITVPVDGTPPMTAVGLNVRRSGVTVTVTVGLLVEVQPLALTTVSV